MAAEKGHLMTLSIDVTATPTAIGLETESEFSLSSDTIETSTKSGFPNRTYVGGWQTFTCSASCLFDATDAAQDQFFTDFQAGTVADITADIGGTDNLAGTGVVTGITFRGAQDGMIEASFEIQGSGAVTKT